MKKSIKILLIMLAITALVSGCVNKNEKIGDSNVNTNLSGSEVKAGDRITIDFILYSDGKVFNTNIKKVAEENNLSTEPFKLKPLSFKIGAGNVIKGLEEGVLGMKLGETKNITIPPEKAFKVDPNLIKTIPRIETIPYTRNISKKFNMSPEEFDYRYGPHKAGDIVEVAKDVNGTVLKTDESGASLSVLLKVGDTINVAPFKEIVTNIDENNITLNADVKKGETINWTAWNTTIIDIDSKNITLNHNYIPDTTLDIPDGKLRVHFNDTYITLDSNPEIAGKTLIIDVTIKSIANQSDLNQTITNHSRIINQSKNISNISNRYVSNVSKNKSENIASNISQNQNITNVS